MLTDYERYQLEWMIEHGHSLKEFVQGLDLVDRDGIDSLEDVYAIWENDYGFGGEVFSNEREFKEEDLPEIMRKPEHETEMGRILKKGGALYSPERGIVIASYLKEEVSPRIEVYYGYPPYVLASLVGRNFGVTVDSSIMDIQDALADPSLPRRFDHELADFASVDEFMSSRFPNSATDWLDVSGNTGLEDMLQLLDIKQTDNVREWYMLAFPDDELVTGINPRLTFVDATRLYRRGTASTPHSVKQRTPSCASASSRSCATAMDTPTMRSMIVGSMSRPFPLPPSRSSLRKSRSRRVTASTSWTQGRPPASTSRAAAPWSPWKVMITKS